LTGRNLALREECLERLCSMNCGRCCSGTIVHNRIQCPIRLCDLRHNVQGCRDGMLHGPLHVFRSLCYSLQRSLSHDDGMKGAHVQEDGSGSDVGLRSCICATYCCAFRSTAVTLWISFAFCAAMTS